MRFNDIPDSPPQCIILSFFMRSRRHECYGNLYLYRTGTERTHERPCRAVPPKKPDKH
jgi:hypothetical protein